MKVVATCQKCGHKVETALEEVLETSSFLPRLFLVEQTRQHTHDDNFKWRLGWQG